MAHKPKPFLKKGQGKYTKIDYPVLRRSGVYQPPPDTPNSNREQRQQPVENTPRRWQTMPEHSFSLHSPSVHRSPPFIPPLNIPAETGVMGQRSPSVSEYSSDSPPRTTKSFGSSLERKMGESDEGVVRDMNNSPGLLSGRPRTAATIDSGFPREELVPLSPASSSGDTHASSFPSMVEDLTYLRPQRNGATEEVLVPRRSPSHSPVTAPQSSIPLPPPPPVVNPSMNDEEVIVEPSLRSIPPVAKRRTLNAGQDGSLIGNTTQEFERREQHAFRDRRDGRTPPSMYSSLASSTSSISKDMQRDMRQLIKEVGEDNGEDPFARKRPQENRVGREEGRREERGLSTVREEVLGGLERPLQQRMMEGRLDESVASDAPLISPIGSQTKARSVEVFEGASFRGSLDSHHESTSHFRIHSPSREEYAVDGDDRRREERGQQPRHVLHPESQPVRRRSADEESERSSGSTADARRFLIGDRRPLDDIRSGRSRGEITMTQQRPLNHRIRASQATLRHPPIGIPEESDRSDGSASSYGQEEETMIIPSRGVNDRRGETRNVMMDRDTLRFNAQLTARLKGVEKMEIQLSNSIAHIDLAEAALKRQWEELLNTSYRNSQKMAYAYAEKEQKLKEEKERIEQMKSELEKEKRLLRKDDSSKVKEWMAKFEEEQKKYAEEKKKNGIETSKSRIREDKLKKENEELTAKVKSLETESDRMRKLLEKSQRDKAIVRGNSAIRTAMTRAEDEAASGQLKNGLMRRRSMNSLVDKENLRPSSSSSSFPSEMIAPPQGILKKNQVRFADTTFTLDPPDETFYETERGISDNGPYSIYANNVGGMITVTKPLCGFPCVFFKYGNGDLRFFNSDTSVVFHYFVRNGSFRFDFPKQRCQVFYFPDGTVEIWRTRREMTRCKTRGGNVERTEVIKRKDGTYYAEIWNNNSMAIYDRTENGETRKGKSKEQFNLEVARNGSTYRESEFGKSDVVLHKSKNLEFFENNFYAVYYAATGNFKLVVNWKKSNEIKYELRPWGSCEIVHGKEGNEKSCISFGASHRTRINEV